MRPAGRRTLVAGLGLAIALAGCSSPSDGDDASTPSSAEAEDADVASPTIGSTSATSTTSTSATPGPVAEGSGCAPGPGALPDGRWYGAPVAVNAGSLDFDLVCLFRDENASRAQVQDGLGPDVVDDEYVRNRDPAIRTLTVDPDVPVTWPPTGHPDLETITYGEWAGRGPHYSGVWVTIEGGRVTDILQPWGA